MQFIHTSLFLPDNQTWLKTWDIVILFLGSHARMLRIICWHSDKERKIIRVNTKVKRRIGSFCDVKLVKIWVNARDDWTRAWVARLDYDNVEACAREYSAALLKLPQPAINSFYIYVISLPCEHVFLGGNVSLPFVCTISECKLLSLKGNRPHTMANKITPLWKKKIFEIN